MDWRENIKIALQSVRANLLRSVLTILIIAFGIMALVGILTAIDAAIFSLNDNFSRLGANSFQIRPLREGGGPKGNRDRSAKQGDPISFRQAIAFQERFKFPAKVGISMRGTSLATIRYEEEKTNPNVTFIGIDQNYLAINGFELAYGRAISNAEFNNASPKALIGMDLVKTLFNDQPESAVNKTISVGNIKYKVVGVLDSKGSSQGNNEDRVIFAPLGSVKRYYGTQNSNYSIVVAVNSAEDLDAASAIATGLFRQVRRLKIAEENDFVIRKSDSLVEIIKENTATLQLSAIAIGMITLLGAAIGLMNIMLVSVTERTKEIGISKAVGATRKNIMSQFLTEAVVICQIGGLLGVLFGILIGNLVALLLGGSFIVPWLWMFIGIVTCLVVGLLSGLYPALKASRLDPIESLRYE